MSRHADRLDEATELAQRFSEMGLDAVRQRNKPEQEPDADGKWPFPECVDCGDDIPEPRLKLGRIRCVDCQEIREKRNGRV